MPRHSNLPRIFSFSHKHSQKERPAQSGPPLLYSLCQLVPVCPASGAFHVCSRMRLFHTGTNGHARQHSQRKAQPQVFRPIQRGGQRHSQPYSKAHTLPAVILPGFLLFLLPAAANAQHRHCHTQNRPGKRCTYKFQDRVPFNPSPFVRPVPLQDPRCWPVPMHPETASALLCGTNARRPPSR